MEETFKFENVAMYRTGFFGVTRTNCKLVVIKTGQKYAQYDNAIRIEYLQKGFRTMRAFMLDYDPWLRIIAAKDAVTPADPMEVQADGSSASKYTSFDPRYTTDFEDYIAGVPCLYSVGVGAREGEHLDRCLAMDGRC